MFGSRSKSQSLWLIVSVLAILGIADSVYLLHLHEVVNSGGDIICDLSNRFSCSTVAISKYAEFMGFPVALWGILAYAFMTAVSVFFVVVKKVPKAIWYLWLLFLAGSLLFSFYLTYAEIFLINAFCIFCLIQQAIILAITGLMWPIKKIDNRL